MGYAFTDVSAIADARAVPAPAVSGEPAIADARASTGLRRPASAPHAGGPVRRDP